MRRFLTATLAIFLLAAPALAVDPNEILPDPAMEHRARDIGKGLRCLVCQNQSIDDSDADLARDLRIIVRERIVAGDTDMQVMDFVVERYGDFVLLKPPLKVGTYLLWFGPLGVFAAALLGVWLFYRQGTVTLEGAPRPLSEDESSRLDALVKENLSK